MEEIMCCKAGCKELATDWMDSGCGEFPFCSEHANEATLEHDYTFVSQIRLDK